MTAPPREPKPCPFCGSNRVSVNEGSTFRWVYAGCEDCGAQAGEVRKQTLGSGTREEWTANAEADALVAWNTRAAPAPPVAQPAEPPAQGEPQERIGTHWDGCAIEGGPRHYDCAIQEIAALRAEVERQAREIADLRFVNEGRGWADEDGTLWCPPTGWAYAQSCKRAERAEAERDALRADAERYRWLFHYSEDTVLGRVQSVYRKWDGESDWRAAVDAARGKP